MQKEPWWIRHRAIGLIVGMFVLFFALIFFGILGFVEELGMHFKGFHYDPVHGGYVHRKTGERC